MLTNFALPRHPIATEQISFKLTGVPPVSSVTIRRIDLEHANAKRHWEQLGKPKYLSPATVDDLKALSRLREESVPFTQADGVLTLDFPMPPQAVAALDIRH
jgi:xylan 1,4-beta-xylosidase